MKNKRNITAVVGILVGFILGFFASQFLGQTSPSANEQPNSTSPQGVSQMPLDHPTPEDLENLASLEQQAEADPQSGKVRVQLGNIYYDMGRFDAAIPWYEEALLLMPNDVNVRTDLGTAYLYSGNPIKAVDLYKQSLNIQPDHAQTLYNIGVTYLSTGNLAEALGSLEQLLKSHPDHPDYEAIQQQIERIRETHTQGAAL